MLKAYNSGEVSMSKLRGKQLRMVIVAASIVAVVAIGGILWATLGSSKKDPYKQVASQQETSSTSDQNSGVSPDSSDSSTSSTPSSNTNSSAAPDPAVVSTIDIPPLSITVSYVKTGVSGFEYEVLRSPDGTKYVEFRNAELVGTKCTNDQGTFASIIENPSTYDSGTISKKVTVDGTVYGLSLAATTCTSNTQLLAAYQDSFSQGFSLLKKSTQN